MLKNQEVFASLFGLCQEKQEIFVFYEAFEDTSIGIIAQTTASGEE